MKCKKCGRKGLFLKVNADGLCDVCENYQAGSFFQPSGPKIMNWETQEIITKTKDNGTPEAMPEAVKMEVLKRAKGCSASSPLTGIINRFSDDLPGVIAQLKREELLTEVSFADDLSLLKMPQLKEISKKFNLKVSGKKNELIERIQDNVWKEELLEDFPFLNDRVYIITEKGKEALNAYAIEEESKLRNLEDECFDLICRKRIGDAYKRVEIYREEQRIPRESEEYGNSGGYAELREEESYGIYCFMNSRLELPSGLSEYEYQMKAILVTTYLIGATVPRLGPLAERALRIPLTDEERGFLPHLFHDAFILICNNRELYFYKQNGIEQYTFLAALDAKTCPICGEMDKKIFYTSEAQIGKNFPPLHHGCRCGTVSYSKDDSPHMRRAKNPVTGESELIESISWSEWTAKNKK